MKPSTKNKNRVIIFHDGNHQFVTEEQEQAYYDEYSKPNVDSIQIDGETIFFSSVARIVSQEKFYQENPEQMPNDRQEIKLPNAWKFSDETKDIQKKILAGFLNYIFKQSDEPKRARSQFESWLNKSALEEDEVHRYIDNNPMPA